MQADSPHNRATRDLTTEEDVAQWVRRFYGDVAQDDLLGPLFEDVAKVDWAEHIPKLTQFWCRALLGIEGYSGNPFRQHAIVHHQSNFSRQHFDRWLDLFHEAVRSNWAGTNATKALTLAHNVAGVHSGQLLGETVDLSQRSSET